MKAMTFLILAGAMLFDLTPAHADVNSYCEAYARAEADGRLTGAAILGPAAPPSREAWEERNAQALADCAAQYETAPAKTETVAAAAPGKPGGLEVGSDGWKSYCAAKYRSFNPKSGTYKSRTGKQRPCVVSDN